MAEKRIVLGIDPGYGRTGYGIITAGQKPTVIDYGVIETAKTEEYSARLLTIHEAIENLIQYYQPVAVGLEELFFCKNVTTAIKVGQARGVIMLACTQAAIPLHELNPMHVKQAITGHGGAEKQDMQKMVQLILNLSETPKPDDAADALGIALATAQQLTKPYA